MPLKIFRTKSSSNKRSSSSTTTNTTATGTTGGGDILGGSSDHNKKNSNGVFLIRDGHHHHHESHHHQNKQVDDHQNHRRHSQQQDHHRVYYERLLQGSPLLRGRAVNPAVPLDRDEVHTSHNDKGLLVGSFYHAYAVSRICLKERHDYYNNTEKEETIDSNNTQTTTTTTSSSALQRKALADISTNQQKGYYSIKCLSKKTLKKLQKSNDKQLLIQCKTNLLIEANYLSKFQHDTIIEVHGMMKMMGSSLDSSSEEQHQQQLAADATASSFLITERIEETLEDRIHKTWNKQHTKDVTLHEVNPSLESYGIKMRYAKDIANALQYLHQEHRIVLLGLSPSSIGFLASSGRLQLCNLGTCRELSAFDHNNKNKNKVKAGSSGSTGAANARPRPRAQSLSTSEQEDGPNDDDKDHQYYNHEDDDVSDFDDDDIGDGERFVGSAIISEEEIDNLMIPMTETGAIPRYVAPEVVLQGTGAVTLQADVYSWAMIVVEMITLQSAFSHYRKGEFLRRVCMEGKRPNLSIYTKLPQSMEAVLRRCWRQSVDKRWTSTQVVEAMEKIIEKQINNHSNPNNTRISNASSNTDNSKQELAAAADDDDDDDDDNNNIAPPLPSRLRRSTSVPETSPSWNGGGSSSGRNNVAIDVVLDGSLMQQSVMTEQSDSSGPRRHRRRRRESASSQVSQDPSAAGGGGGGSGVLLPAPLLAQGATMNGGSTPITDDSLMRQSIVDESSNSRRQRRGSKSRSSHSTAIPKPLLHRAVSAPAEEVDTLLLQTSSSAAVEQSSTSRRRSRRRSSASTKSQSVGASIPAPLLQDHDGPDASTEDTDLLPQQSTTEQSSTRVRDSDQRRRKSCLPPPARKEAVTASGSENIPEPGVAASTKDLHATQSKKSTPPRRTRSSCKVNRHSATSRVKSKSPRRVKSSNSESNNNKVFSLSGMVSSELEELQAAARRSCPEAVLMESSGNGKSIETNISNEPPKNHANKVNGTAAVSVKSKQKKGSRRSVSPMSPKSPCSKRSSSRKDGGVETRTSGHKHLKDISASSPSDESKPAKRSSKGERKRESHGKASHNQEGEGESAAPDLGSKRSSKSSNTSHLAEHSMQEGSKGTSAELPAQDTDPQMAHEEIEGTPNSPSKATRTPTPGDLKKKKKKKKEMPKCPQNLEGDLGRDPIALVAQACVNPSAKPTNSKTNDKTHTARTEKKIPKRRIRRTMSAADVEGISAGAWGEHSNMMSPVPSTSSSKLMRDKPAAADATTKRPSLRKAASFLGFGRKPDKSNIGATATTIERGSNRFGKDSMMSLQKHASDRMLNRR